MVTETRQLCNEIVSVTNAAAYPQKNDPNGTLQIVFSPRLKQKFLAQSLGTRAELQAELCPHFSPAEKPPRCALEINQRCSEST